MVHKLGDAVSWVVTAITIAFVIFLVGIIALQNEISRSSNPDQVIIILVGISLFITLVLMGLVCLEKYRWSREK